MGKKKKTVKKAKLTKKNSPKKKVTKTPKRKESANVLRAREFEKQGDKALSGKNYKNAENLYFLSYKLYESNKDISKMGRNINYCKEKLLGGKNPTSSKKKTPKVKGPKRVTIKSVIYELFKVKGIDKVTVAEAVKAAKGVKADTKFKDTHLAYWKNIFKREN